MNAAISDAAHTITVAASHVPTPSIVSPSEIRSVTINRDQRGDQRHATQGGRLMPAQLTRHERRHQPQHDGEDDDVDDEPGRVEVHTVEDDVGDEQTDGVREQEHERANQEPDHAANLPEWPQRFRAFQICSGG